MLKDLKLSIFVIIIGIASNTFADNLLAVTNQYEIKGGSVYDKKTKLTWARCSVGQKWDAESGCVGIIKTFTFDEAQHQAGGGWRVPTKDELGSLVDHLRTDNKQKPTIDEVAFPNMDFSNLGYWTSSPAGDSGGWDVNFSDGSINGYYGYRSNTLAVRLVRNEH